MPGDRSRLLGPFGEGRRAGIEIKNIREWIYPNCEEVTELLLKAAR
jgi:hypothetical protein